MTQMYIADPESGGTFDYSDYQFSIIADLSLDFPPIHINSVLRIHHMAAEDFQGQTTFR